MKFVKAPKNFEKEQWSDLVVGYFNKKAIVKSESGRLSFIRCEEHHAPIGTSVPTGQAEPIEKLSEREQLQIQEIYKDK